MGRMFGSKTVAAVLTAWSLVASPSLCAVTILEHLCDCGESGCCAPPCCDHEADCDCDPCGTLVVRSDSDEDGATCPHLEASRCPAGRGSGFLPDAAHYAGGDMGYLPPPGGSAEPGRHAPALNARGSGANLPFPRSDIPLLI